MREIYIYSEIKLWIDDTPDTVIKGQVIEKSAGHIVIEDENGLIQTINLRKLFAVVY